MYIREYLSIYMCMCVCIYIYIMLRKHDVVFLLGIDPPNPGEAEGGTFAQQVTASISKCVYLYMYLSLCVYVYSYIYILVSAAQARRRLSFGNRSAESWRGGGRNFCAAGDATPVCIFVSMYMYLSKFGLTRG